MTRLGSQWLFEPRYAETAAGLLAAETELVCLTARHAAYAAQPNVTPFWQGYIDQQQAAVTRQRLTVETLRAGLDADHQPSGRSAHNHHGGDDV